RFGGQGRGGEEAPQEPGRFEGGGGGPGEEGGPADQADGRAGGLRQHHALARGALHAPVAALAADDLAGMAYCELANVWRLPDRHRGGTEQGFLDDAHTALAGHVGGADHHDPDGDLSVRGRYRLGQDPELAADRRFASEESNGEAEGRGQPEVVVRGRRNPGSSGV